MRLFLDRVPSPLGHLWVVTDEAAALRALDFDEYEARMRELLQRHYGTVVTESRATPQPLIERLGAYFAGQLSALDDVVTCTGGTPFQQQVWQTLRTIPAGATMSYGELARSLGNPGASRAVGLANGNNPIAIVVPCHRVVGHSGSLTGYAGGLPRKRWLLAHERRHGAEHAERLFG